MLIVNESLEGVTTRKLKKSIKRIKKELNQDSIMIKKEKQIAYSCNKLDNRNKKGDL